MRYRVRHTNIWLYDEAGGDWVLCAEYNTREEAIADLALRRAKGHAVSTETSSPISTIQGVHDFYAKKALEYQSRADALRSWIDYLLER